jgi:haloalkane dehalogenase
MIPHLVAGGIRVIAPDLPGYGKSDKPASREDYSYQRQVDWMTKWLNQNDFKDITFFGQDWGGLIGLRMITEEPDLFVKVSMGNTGLPYNPDASDELQNKVKAFREEKIKLTLFSMARQVQQMDASDNTNEDFHPALKFMYWQKFCWDTVNLPIGVLCSFQMDKKSRPIVATHYFFQRMGLEKISPFSTDVSRAYEAPFPDPSYKMGPRAMPSHVPTLPDSSLEAQRLAREFFKTSDKPFLSVFAGDDPVTNGIESDVLEMAPNAKSAPHIGGGHFYQWSRAEELSKILIDFIKLD